MPFGIFKLFLYMRVGILLTYGKHLLDRITTLTGVVWEHKTSLTAPSFILLYQHIKMSS
jgi:hypothetical protein